MSSIGTGYDLSASQFSPEGKVFQTEYALKAVENSGTAVALRGKDGVVFAIENTITSKLYEPGSNKRIFNIDHHVGMAVSGLLADAAHLAETARDECFQYRSFHGAPIPLSHLADRLAMYVHAHTLYSSVRPFGCSVMLSSFTDIEGAQLYVIEPSGIYFSYNSCATGKAKQNAKTELEKMKVADMTCVQLIKEATRIIYMVHDDVKDKTFELELSWVGNVTNGKHQVVPKATFDEAVVFAKEALAEPDSDNDL